jgi:hypothetical protein
MMTVGRPFVQADWPNPVRRIDSIALRTWVNGVQIQTPPAPYKQTEWPNPLPKAPNLALRSWFNGIPPGALAVQIPPVRNYDWPNPRQRAPNLELRSFYVGLSAIYAPVIPPYVEDTRVVVPYLIGSTAAHATAQLASVHLLVDVIGLTGTVTAQDVAAFSLVARGTTVTIMLGGSTNNPTRGGRGLPDYTLPN